MRQLQSVFTLLKLLQKGSQGQPLDFVVVVQGNKLVVTAMNGRPYDYLGRSTQIKEPVVFRLSDNNTCEVDVGDNLIDSVVIQEDLRGDRIVMVKVENGRTPNVLNVVVRIPKIRHGHALTLDEPQKHPLRELIEQLAGGGGRSGLHVIGMPGGIGSQLGLAALGGTFHELGGAGDLEDAIMDQSFGLGGFGGPLPRRREQPPRRSEPPRQTPSSSNSRAPETVGASGSNGSGSH